MRSLLYNVGSGQESGGARIDSIKKCSTVKVGQLTNKKLKRNLVW